MPIVILGKGGHARVLEDCWWQAGIECKLVDWDSKIEPDDELLLGFTDTRKRRELIEQHGAERFTCIIHPKANLSSLGENEYGYALQAMAGVIVEPDAKIGDFVVLNTGAQINHDCVLEDFAVVAPGAVLLGGVTLKEGGFVGANATVLGGMTIGSNAIVGAGAVVTMDVQPHTIVAGNPARLLRMRRDDE